MLGLVSFVIVKVGLATSVPPKTNAAAGTVTVIVSGAEIS